MFENVKIYNPSKICVVVLRMTGECNILNKKTEIDKLDFKKPETIVLTKPRKQIDGYFYLKDLINDKLYKCDNRTFYNSYDIVPEEITTLDRLMKSPHNLNLEELYRCKSLLNEFFIKQINNDKIKYKQKLLEFRIN